MRRPDFAGRFPPAGSLVHALVLAATTAGSGLLSLFLGQDVNFDQRNYHVYLGWSVLAGRLDQDVAPAVAGSYLNPLIHVLSYLGLVYLPPRVFGFALGAVHGLNAYLVYRLARHVLKERPAAPRHAAIASLVAMTGASAVSLLGTTFGDNLLSLLVLAGFLLAATAPDRPPRSALAAMFGAGLLGGAAAGLKLTFAPYAAGLAATSIVVAACRRRWATPLALAGGLALGGLLGGGYWAWQMWSHFANPLFPFSNAAFPSPFDGPDRISPDSRWASRGWVDLLAAPVEMALGLTARLQEVPFRDGRCALAVALAGVALPVALRLAWTRTASGRSPSSARSRDPLAPNGAVLVLVVGWVTAYVVWNRVFHYYRYFAAGEFLAPVVVLALLAVLSPARLRVLWPLAAVVMLASSATGSWGRIAWRDEPLTVRYATGARPVPAAVIVDGKGLSYVLPFLPPGSRFFGFHVRNRALHERAARELARHPGPFLRLIDPGAVPSDLGWLGLADTGECGTLRTGGRGRVLLCALVRTPPERGAASASARASPPSARP